MTREKFFKLYAAYCINGYKIEEVFHNVEDLYKKAKKCRPAKKEEIESLTVKEIK